MQHSIRTFLALDVSSEVRSKAGQLIRRLSDVRGKISWVRPEQLHLTLKFLGDVDARELPEVCNAVAAVAGDQAPFDFEVKGAGAFPAATRPRTIWLGVTVGVPELRALHLRLDRELGRLGFRSEGRQFQPHLTIGRVRSADGAEELADLLATHADFFAGVCSADELVVYSSDRQPTGPVYEPVSVSPLSGT